MGYLEKQKFDNNENFLFHRGRLDFNGNLGTYNKWIYDGIPWSVTGSDWYLFVKGQQKGGIRSETVTRRTNTILNVDKHDTSRPDGSIGYVHVGDLIYENTDKNQMRIVRFGEYHTWDGENGVGFYLENDKTRKIEPFELVITNASVWTIYGTIFDYDRVEKNENA